MKISRVSLALYLLAAFTCLDFIFSGINLNRGAYEINPLYHLLGQAGFIIMKTLFSGAFLIIFPIGYNYVNIDERKFLWFVLGSLTVFYGFVSFANITTFLAL